MAVHHVRRPLPPVPGDAVGQFPHEGQQLVLGDVAGRPGVHVDHFQPRPHLDAAGQVRRVPPGVDRDVCGPAWRGPRTGRPRGRSARRRPLRPAPPAGWRVRKPWRFSWVLPLSRRNKDLLVQSRCRAGLPVVRAGRPGPPGAHPSASRNCPGRSVPARPPARRRPAVGLPPGWRGAAGRTGAVRPRRWRLHRLPAAPPGPLRWWPGPRPACPGASLPAGTGPARSSASGGGRPGSGPVRGAVPGSSGLRGP